MGDLHDIAVERAKRQPRVTTGNRHPSRIEQVIRKQREMERPRKGDTVDTVKGRAFVIDDTLLAWCKGEAFYLTPDHIVRPEDGVA